MRLRPYIPETDFEIIREWIDDPRTHALWCANRFAYPLDRDNFEGVIARNGDSPFAALDDEGRLAGFFCYAHHPETKDGLLKFVVVDPAVRGQGLGRAMLQLAADYAFGTGKAGAVYLRVFTNNPRAIKCYEHAGFTEKKTEPDAFTYGDELWGCRTMVIQRTADP